LPTSSKATPIRSNNSSGAMRKPPFMIG
jgi:hypothetical protein